MNPNFVIAYTLAFLFVSLKVGGKLDTKRARKVFNIRTSTSPTSLNQVDGYTCFALLVVGANLS
jgi:hypothetical protein